MADWNKSKNQESWTSQVNKFCKYCKCWVADNKVIMIMITCLICVRMVNIYVCFLCSGDQGES